MMRTVVAFIIGLVLGAASFTGAQIISPGLPAPLSCDGTNCTMASGRLDLAAGTYTAPALSLGNELAAGSLFTSGGTLTLRGGFNVRHSSTSTLTLIQVASGDVGRIEVSSDGRFAFGDGSIGTIDTFLMRAAAANLRLGLAAANPPVAQTLSVQNASGSNVAGANYTIDASQGTGTGAGGSVIIRTAAAGGAGSSLNTLATALTINSSGVLLASVATGGIGYGTGAGGTVTQLTDKATGVTLSVVSAEITMSSAALAGDTAVSFTWTNTAIAATDHVLCTHDSGGTAASYNVVATSAAGSSVVTVRNVSTVSLSEAIVLKCSLLKGATS